MKKLSKYILGLFILLVSTNFIFAQNNALDFDGTDDYVNIPGPSDFDFSSSDMTISMWVKFNSTDRQCLVSKRESDDKEWYLELHNTQGLRFAHDWSGTNVIGFSEGTVNITTGVWYHIALIKSGNSWNIYKNGESVASTTDTDPLNNPSANLELGTLKSASWDTQFNGNMDEVRIWNTALNITTIRDWMYKEITTDHPQYDGTGGANDHLVAYYKMSDGSGTSLTDNSANSHTGTLYNGGSVGNGPNWVTSGAFVGPRNALDFDGGDDYVTMGDVLDFERTDPFTIEAWVNMGSLGGSVPSIVTKRGGSSTNYKGYVFGYHTSNNHLIFYLTNNISTNTILVNSSVISIEDNSWHYVSVTYDGSSSASGVTFYVDGQVLTGNTNTQDNLSATTLTSEPLNIGSSFNVQMDEVRIWDTARTVAQIRENMCKTIEGNESGLKAYYRFDYGTAGGSNSGLTTLYDITSNNNDGTLNNFALSGSSSNWVSSTAFNTWIGSEGTGWATDGNWSRNADPVSTDNVGIPDYANDPMISTAANWNNLVVCENANLTLGADVTPGGKTFVNGTLALSSNKITTSSANLLTLGTSGSITKSTGFVNGPVAKVTNSISTFTFPTGKNSTFRQIGITPLSADETTFTAEYFDEAYSNTSSLSGLNNVSTVEYFTLDKSGDANAKVILHWGSNSGVNNLTDLRVAKWDGSQWTDEGNSGTTGDASAGTITSNVVSSFSPFTFGSSSSDNSLPVELSSFTAYQEKSAVVLEWITESEIENLGFILERRILNIEPCPTVRREGMSNDEVWKKIASYLTDDNLKGHGSTSQSHEYKYIDKAVQPGMTYEYRLSDVSYNGVVKQHGTCKILVKTVEESTIPEKFGLTSIYPNPFNPVTNIAFSLRNESEVSVMIMDLLGREVRQLVNERRPSGNYTVTWDGKNYAGIESPSGIYFIVMRANGFVSSHKAILFR